MRLIIVIMFLGIGGATVVHERKLSADLVNENARHRTEAEQLSLRIRELEREIAWSEAEIKNAEKREGAAQLISAKADVATNNVGANAAATLKREHQQQDFYLHKRHLRSLGVSALTPELRISDEIAAVLALTPEERRAVQEKMDAFAATVQQMELANLRPTNQPPASVAKREGIKYAYHLPAMPEEGKRLKEELVGSLQQSIGAQRTEFLTEKVDWENQFNKLAKDETFLTFIDVPQADGTYQRYVSIWHPHDEKSLRVAPGDLPKALEHLFRIDVPQQGQP
jgi:hypothetical protein